MSKKKATMTLKDFHGGSIPSDLPLPSAPGVTARPADRGGFDRQMSWGNSSMGRTEHRLRPASAGSTRNLDDKTPFLGHIPHIGRNFDEDERKPLDGVSGPRRMISDDTFHAQSPRVVESKIDNLSGSRVSTRPVSGSGGSSGNNSYAGRLSEVNNHNLSGNRNYGPNVGQASNAWGIKKETGLSLKEPVSSTWSAPDAETKLAHASALEKVSSGRWNSKQQHVHHPQKDAEVFGHVETEKNIYNKNNYNRLDVAGDVEYHAENKSSHHVESYQKKSPVTANNGFQQIRPKSGGPEFQLPSEASERPKLKLLPRSKPLENLEASIDYKQTSDVLQVEDSYRLNEPSNPVQSGFVAPVVGDQAVERPKLNLKPRSQPLEHLEEKGEVKRGTVFGAARPREMILKGRGIEDDVSTYERQPSLRVKEDAPTKIISPRHVVTPRYTEKPENTPGDQKTGKYTHRRDHQVDVDPQRRNRRNEGWRNNNNNSLPVEKQQPQQERPPSPETWRKPVEKHHEKQPDGSTVRYGKAASAVELAQAFSKSVSDPTIVSSGPRGLPARNQMPFSRLTGPTPRSQINGY